MAIAFRAAATLDVTADDTTWDISTPSGTADGDFLFAFLVCSTTTPACATPTGWTRLGTAQTSPSNDSRGYLFYKIAAGEGASTTFTWSGGTTRTGAACMIAYSGADTTLDAGSSAGTFASSATPSAPAITPAANSEMVVYFMGTDQAVAATWTASSGYTERVDFQDSGPLCTIHSAELQQTTATATTPTPTLTTADEGVAFTVALKTPAAGGITILHSAVLTSG